MSLKLPLIYHKHLEVSLFSILWNIYNHSFTYKLKKLSWGRVTLHGRDQIKSPELVRPRIHFILRVKNFLKCFKKVSMRIIVICFGAMSLSKPLRSRYFSARAQIELSEQFHKVQARPVCFQANHHH